MLKRGETADRQMTRESRVDETVCFRQVTPHIELGRSTRRGAQGTMFVGMYGRAATGIAHFHPLDTGADADLDPARAIGDSNASQCRQQ